MNRCSLYGSKPDETDSIYDSDNDWLCKLVMRSWLMTTRDKNMPMPWCKLKLCLPEEI